MLRYMLDTNLCIRVLRDRPVTLRERFNLEADGLCISTIVLTELLHGAAKSARPEQNRLEIERFAGASKFCRSIRKRLATPAKLGRSWSAKANRSAATTC